METLTALLAQQPVRMSTRAAQNASRKVAASRATEDPDGNAWTRLRTHIQNMTAAARAIADRNRSAQRS